MRKEFDPRSITASRSLGVIDSAYWPRRRCRAAPSVRRWAANCTLDSPPGSRYRFGAGRGARAREFDRDARRWRGPRGAAAGSLAAGSEARGSLAADLLRRVHDAQVLAQARDGQQALHLLWAAR